MEALTASVDEEFKRWADPDLNPPMNERTTGRRVVTIGAEG
jgi:hypothetical protein